MTFQLILAGPNQPGVALSRKITKELQTYKKNAIRFIYNCYVTSVSIKTCYKVFFVIFL